MSEEKQGWISLHRKIKDHWLYPDKGRRREFTRFEAWLDILLNVNHTNAKVPIGNQLIECKRGQSVRSLETWRKRWNWKSKNRVRNFLGMLENDSMIVTESVTVSVRITICNYDKYQYTENAPGTRRERVGNASGTRREPNNNVNNEKNEKNEKNALTLTPFYNFFEKANNPDFDEKLIESFRKIFEKKLADPVLAAREAEKFFYSNGAKGWLTKAEKPINDPMPLVEKWIEKIEKYPDYNFRERSSN